MQSSNLEANKIHLDLDTVCADRRSYRRKGLALVQDDCLQLLARLPDNSVDLIATDPPYYKVKGDSWDRQWATKADFFSWLDRVVDECQRVLKPTGSLYLFCGPYLSSETELLIDQRLKVLNHIVWVKPSGRWNGCNKESLTKFFPQTERIIFAESRKKKPFMYEPIRAHIADAVKVAGLAAGDVNRLTGTQMSNHWLGRSQFSLPSEAHYETLQQHTEGLKPWAELKAEYVEIRDRQKGKGRYFGVTKDVMYTDVWQIPTVSYYPGKHPCEKPLSLMSHIIRTSSQPGDVVVDLFVGSGSTAIAARQLGRAFIGSEMGEAEFDQAVGRFEKELEAG